MARKLIRVLPKVMVVLVKSRMKRKCIAFSPTLCCLIVVIIEPWSSGHDMRINQY